MIACETADNPAQRKAAEVINYCENQGQVKEEDLRGQLCSTGGHAEGWCEKGECYGLGEMEEDDPVCQTLKQAVK